MKHLALTILAATGALSVVRGQGLLTIGPSFDDGERLPFSFTVNSSLGWDSDPSASSGIGGGLSGASADQGSMFWRNGISVHYPMGGRGRDHLILSGDYSNTWYLDPAPGTQEFSNTGRISLDYFRQITRRFALSDSAYVSYQTEPDFTIGASVNNRTSGYFYASNRLSGSFAWTRRFSTVTSYTFTDIWYDQDRIPSEDHFEHTFSEQFRYAIKRRTTGIFDYRYSFTQYPDNAPAESQSHFVLAGVDHSFSRFLSANFIGGVEFRAYDGTLGSRAAPYGEAGLVYRVRKHSTLRWYNRLGLEDTGSAGAQSGYAYRTGIALSQRLTPRLSLNLSLNYVHTTYSDGLDGGAGLTDGDEDTIDGSVGLSYLLWRNLSVTANYSYTKESSDVGLNDYDRHRVSLGLSATF